MTFSRIEKYEEAQKNQQNIGPSQVESFPLVRTSSLELMKKENETLKNNIEELKTEGEILNSKIRDFQKVNDENLELKKFS